MPALLRLAWPLILGELGWVSMSIVDTVMVGHLPHAAIPLSAAALAQVLFNTFVIGFGGMLLGLDTLVSQAFGAREIDSANRWLWHGLALACALAGVLVCGFTLAPAMLHHVRMDPEVYRQTVPALRGLTWGVLPLLVYFALRRYLQAGHHTRPIAFAVISANAINIGFDWLLIYGHSFHRHQLQAYGVTGSSWATSLSRLYMMLVLVVALLVLDKKHAYGVRRMSRRIHWQHMRQLLQLGGPIGLQIFVEIAIFALVTTLCSLLGPVTLAGHEAALTCASTSFMVPLAICSATAVRVGHNLGQVQSGRSSATRVRAAGWCGILIGGLFMLCTAIVIALWPQAIARIFTPDAGVIAAAIPLLRIAAGFQFFDGLQVTASGALRGLGDTTAPLLTHLFCYWAIAMPLGVWLCFDRRMGASGLWLGLLTGLTLAAIFLVARWQRVSLKPLQAMPLES
jgi:MATE family multidrug resistance protein